MTTQAPDDNGRSTSEDTQTSPAAEPTDVATAAAPESEHPRGAAVGGGATTLASFLALALACCAAAAAGFLWWQYRQFYVALDRADGETEIALREIRAGLRGLEDAVGEVEERRLDLTRVVEQIVDRVDAFPGRLAELDEKVAAAQGVSADARGRWLRAQAEYYLGVANAELGLRRDRNNAITALELADRALLDAGNPAYAPVRERIAGELLALRGMRVADVEGLSYGLSQLAARVPALAMRAPRSDGEDPAGAAQAEPGVGRLWQSFKRALASMFSIERHDAVAYSLPLSQQALVRRQLELELALARLGLVQAMPELLAASLASASTLLETHFVTDDAGVEGALALLADMRQLEIAPRYPDISGSLALLRDVPVRDN